MVDGQSVRWFTLYKYILSLIKADGVGNWRWLTDGRSARFADWYSRPRNTYIKNINESQRKNRCWSQDGKVWKKESHKSVYFTYVYFLQKNNDFLPKISSNMFISIRKFFWNVINQNLFLYVCIWLFFLYFVLIKSNVKENTMFFPRKFSILKFFSYIIKLMTCV